ncbi:hypothetical protein [Tenacibaculum ovolyticum]|uniref:hypothetical protein n=1 Tax=Tenacibaculum ovolyticum TaxID=104270 RepID=UPI003BA9A6AA
MKKILIFLIAIVFNTSVKAQKKTHVIELKIEKEQKVNDFYISKIIDNRLIKSNIGFVQKGLFNKRVVAVFPDSIQSYLNSKLYEIYPKREGTAPITLIIHEFNISEQTKALSEKGIFRTQLEFAQEKSGKLYSLWYLESVVEGGGLDVTKKHGARIIKGITESLIEFSKSNWKDKKGELIELKSSIAFDYTHIPKPGLYSNFSKLAKNEPFLEDNYIFLRKKNKKIEKFKLLNSDEKKINKRVIFVSDGEDIFMHASRYSYDSHFIKSLLIGKYIYFEDRVSDPAAAIAFGLIGAALSNTVRGVVLDTKTGLVHQLDKKNMLNILEPYPELKKKYLKTSKKNKFKKLAIQAINELNKFRN